MPKVIIPSSTKRVHSPQIVSNVVPGNGESKYKFKVQCDCQWQALAINKHDADTYADSHIRYHEVYGG